MTSETMKPGTGISEKEFGTIFTKCRPSFLRIANSYVHNLQAAEDIINDSFTRMWERRGDIIADNYEAYAFRVIINNCLDYLKAQSVKAKAKQNIHDAASRMVDREIMSLKDCDPNALFTSEVETLFRTCVACMPSVTRNVFVASRFDGMTYKEISMRYGIPVRQVTSHMQAALKLLRTDLKDYLVAITTLILATLHLY